MKNLEWKSPTSKEVWEQLGYTQLGNNFTDLLEKNNITILSDISELLDKLLIVDIADLALFEYWSVPAPERDEIKTVKDLCDYVSQRANVLIVPSSNDGQNENTIFKMLKQLIYDYQTNIDMKINSEDFALDLVNVKIFHKILCIIHRSFPIQNQWEINIVFDYTKLGRTYHRLFLCSILVILCFTYFSFLNPIWLNFVFVVISMLAAIALVTYSNSSIELKAVKIKDVNTVRELAKVINNILWQKS